ncbi:MAG: hypothetical protein WCC99_19995 [Candidatus Sulfotelmatobacter sp.]
MSSDHVARVSDMRLYLLCSTRKKCDHGTLLSIRITKQRDEANHARFYAKYLLEAGARLS